MMLWSKILFVIVFLGQIGLISYHYPKLLHARMQDVITRFPPAEYPRLYPKPVEYYKIGQWGFMFGAKLVFGLGFVFLLAALTIDNGSFADDGYISEIWPAIYGMIQFIPLALLEIAEFRHFKLMREANPVTRRSAELRPRRILDYVSVRLVTVALFACLATVLVDLAASDFDLALGSDSVQRSLILIAVNLAMVLAGIWSVYGQQHDPHQSERDRARRLRVSLASMLFVSIAVSLFTLAQVADQVFDLDFLDAVMISLYFQAIVALSIGHLLRSFRLEEIDFEVYRDATPATVAVSGP